MNKHTQNIKKKKYLIKKVMNRRTEPSLARKLTVVSATHTQ